MLDKGVYDDRVRVLRVTIEGHLDLALLAKTFSPVEAQLKRESDQSFALWIDVRKMTGYDREARSEYIKWFQQHKSRLAAAAVLTHNITLRVAIAGVGLVLGGKVKPFESDDAAKNWLESLA